MRVLVLTFQVWEKRVHVWTRTQLFEEEHVFRRFLRIRHILGSCQLHAASYSGATSPTESNVELVLQLVELGYSPARSAPLFSPGVLYLAHTEACRSVFFCRRMKSIFGIHFQDLYSLR